MRVMVTEKKQYTTKPREKRTVDRAGHGGGRGGGGGGASQSEARRSCSNSTDVSN